MDPVAAEHAIAGIADAEERRVARLLRDAGLELVAANSRFYDAAHVPTAEIDLVFASRGTTWIVEVSGNSQAGGRRKKRRRLREWAAGEATAEVALKHELPRANRVRLLYFDMSDRPGGGAGDVAGGNGVTILHVRHVQQLERAVGEARARARAALDELVDQGA